LFEEEAAEHIAAAEAGLQAEALPEPGPDWAPELSEAAAG